MPRRAATSLVTPLALLVTLTASCTSGLTGSFMQPAEPSSQERAGAPTIAVEPSSDDTAGSLVEDEAPGPIPITREDPVRGRQDAPVTLVMFTDFECPFCKRMHRTVEQLCHLYGPEKLRVVWKNYPLAFHKNARPAAEAAMAVFTSRGPAAFWAFHDTLLAAEEPLTASLQEDAAHRAGLDRAGFNALLETGTARQQAARKVDADLELAQQLGVTATPASFINGVFLGGAQPLERFTEIIDAQLEAALRLRRAGVPASRVYGTLTQMNHTPRAKPQSVQAAEDSKRYRVPVGDSPVRGKATALITMVMFAEIQCPFCAKVEPTLDQLAAQYGDDLRIVWKHNPLPFHPRAEPAAQLALEARAQKGDAAFWSAIEQLFTNQRNLDDDTLAGIAKSLKLSVPATLRAIATHKHRNAIEADQELADDVDARGVPHFFINGRRLTGAQPLTSFQALIDEELALTKVLVAKGTPRDKLYEELQREAVEPTPPPKVSIAAPTARNPRRGAPQGKVVVQVFSDFQCPFCARVNPTLDALLKAYPNEVNIVWRNKTLPFHAEAQLAAEAAMEAFTQKGSTGFWRMHDLLFLSASPDNLDRPALQRHAAQVGLDMKKFNTALDSGIHRAAVEADNEVAEAAKLNGTPSFVINGYVVTGAQPLSTFKRVVKRALAEVK
ncbi:thioredoxin domain-containing protein [Chondromyces crocatus]|uniref:Thioredoxin domain-containing protein n=1 Tax=Chondromyces crocatus TaxID=52 RepID=A0A0K1E6W2_CHOCO|nr:thioredoxin domain-containing protein [Chondromyces crocatus]AKT36318.1 uncharacterized protein CMC5_004320 [Chondromyces crocatus]